MKRFGIGIIGLGSIGSRMLKHAAVHERVQPIAVFDPDGDRVANAISNASMATGVASCAALISHPGVDIVYVASPPTTHAEHARTAIDAGKAVLCEKPLGIGLEESHALVEHAQASGLPNAVNFIYASAYPAVVMRNAVHTGVLGKVSSVDIELRLRDWAKRRYAEAPWLARDEQGGFAREVLSHYLFLAQSLFGPVRLLYSNGRFPSSSGSAICQLVAELECDGIPVYVRGSTEGAGPDCLQMTLRGEQETLCAYDLYGIRRITDSGSTDMTESPDPAADWHRRQFDNLARMLEGKANTMPDFQTAYAVQVLIEAVTKR